MRSWEDRLIAMKKAKTENDTTVTTTTDTSNNISSNSNSSSLTSSISRPPLLKCSDDSEIKLGSNGSIKIKVTEESQRASISRLLESGNKKSSTADVLFTRTFIRYFSLVFSQSFHFIILMYIS